MTSNEDPFKEFPKISKLAKVLGKTATTSDPTLRQWKRTSLTSVPIKEIYIGNRTYEVNNGFTKKKIMTREEAKQLLPIIKAFSEGKVIEGIYKNIESPWFKVEDMVFDGRTIYRIKSELKYRPFKNKEECWQEMLKHQPFAWVKEKHSDRYSLITEVNGLSIKVKEGCLFTDGVKYYTFADGTPFGIKEEE